MAWRSTPLCPAGHLPLKGGDWQLHWRRLPYQRWRLAKAKGQPISPLEGEMSGRTEGGAVPPTSRK
ncbi:MAG: lytic murein transglycosylase [Mesorhizobium sp.]|nr:MAG: lytic murein transglycosylase [Mesorhizobium sp.]RWO28264.1 MAG: lytic murein transglycosylase [Mesorhizobium sp.]RWO33743.1 MAG: lytic murein transglycosylase [Mesorhizobium sp.]TIN08851.1 MAG: lytic murein transglycosylase [Mesorhizobium sp.]